MTSVIIPTFQGELKISNCIDALLSQSDTDFEIVIAIDGSTDNTEQIVNEKLKNHSNFKIVRQENKGRASIRNFGAKNASGDILIFYDDDTRASSESVDLHKTFHSNNENLVLQGALVSDKEILITDIQIYKAHLENIWEQSLISDSGIVNGTYLSAANFSIQKKLFNIMNGFKEELLDCEDFELSTRLKESNVSVYYDPNNYVFHDDPITLVQYISRKRDYTRAHLELLDKYPNILEKYSERTFVPRKGIKKLIYRFLASKKLVSIIDDEHFIIKALPKSLRFKLYDLTIQSLSNYYPNKQIHS